MREDFPLPMIFAVIVFTIGFFWLKFRYARGVIAKHLEAGRIDAEIVKVGIPPVRHWGRYRKGDAWCLLRFPDGAERWGRLRGHLFQGRSYDVFD